MNWTHPTRTKQWALFGILSMAFASLSFAQEIELFTNDPNAGQVQIHRWNFGNIPYYQAGTENASDGPGVYAADVVGLTVDARVRLTAIPAPGFIFSEWTGDLPAAANATANPVQFRVPDAASREITAVFIEDEDAELSISLTILPLGYDGLDGVGTGEVEVSVNGGPFAPYNPAARYEQADVIRLRAIPGMLGPYQSFMFEWDGDIPESVENALRPHPLEIQFVMGENSRDIDVLFSREYHPGEAVGDLDLDGLPDVWEIRWGLDPKDPLEDNGPNGNQDFSMPTGWQENRFGSGEYPAAIADLNTDWPYRFHIDGSRPINYYVGVAPFDNWHRARGFDGWYGVNPLTGLNDSPHSGVTPGVNPNLISTAGDGIPDGWKYWFWGSAINYFAHDPGDPSSPPNVAPYDDPEYTIEGVALGTYTDPNNPAPAVPITRAEILAVFSIARTLGVDPEDDLDNDCVTMLEEYIAGTDPLHWDTDGDGMSDGWELRLGLDPLDPDDASDSSGDWMAFFVDDDGNELRHNQVYTALGFDPRTAWGEHYLGRGETRELQSQVNTISFTHLEKYRASVYLANLAGEVFNCENFTRFALSITSIDSDEDGIFDGWELYVGLDPLNPDDAGLDPDDDGLTNFQEFSSFDKDLILGVPWPNGFQHFDSAWLNKVWPTDPFNRDTDGDGLSDGAEGGYQNVPNGIGNLGELKYANGEVIWNGHCYVGGGLNPTSADTDGDYLPDHWEARFRSSTYSIEDQQDRNGMDPTVRDASLDYDGDGLLNYQEYLVGAVHHWRYRPDFPPISDGLPPGLPLGSHDPMYFFTGTPQEWDWHATTPGDWPYSWIEHIEHRYNSTDPRMADSDMDGMDDYWKIFHGLNPTYGTLDLQLSMYAGGEVAAAIPPTYDIRIMPFAAGHPYADPDEDGLPNFAESIQPNDGPPFYYHTDPSPLWVTDTSYQRSWVNLYYAWNPAQPWYFNEDVLRGLRPPPTYMFSFGVNEGFDTDGDFISDRNELLHTPASPGVTDPLSVESPVRRAALYLEGQSAARTRAGFLHSYSRLKDFTIEAWVRPANPASGQPQIIIDRPFRLPSGRPTGPATVLRSNFRLGLDAAGVPFVSYNGAGEEPLSGVIAQASLQSALQPDVWYHLAGVYDGDANQLRLYINGNLQSSFTSAERPATGWDTGNPSIIRFAPLVVGATDLNPNSWVIGIPSPWVGPFAGVDYEQPVLDHHFHGWVDEIRIWDGPRSTAVIQENMSRAMKMADIVPTAGQPGELMYLYNFNSLHDPIVERVAPDGFDLLSHRPNDGSYPHVPWWGLANDRSLIYDDYHYVPWIPNIAARIPLDPPADSPSSFQSFSIETITLEVVTNVTVETEGDEVTEVVTVTTNEVVEVSEGFRSFPNSANPYNMAYYHRSQGLAERNPDLWVHSDESLVFARRDANLFNDLLPLGLARADISVELWDGMGSGGLEGVGDTLDENNDGIPDWWQRLYWPDFDPNATGPNPWDPGADPDGDGLTNLEEFLLGTNPLSFDSNFGAGGITLSDYDRIIMGTGLTGGEIADDGDGMPYAWEMQFPGYLDPYQFDAFDDPDGDGWDNLSEFLAGTDPSDPNDMPRPTVNVLVEWDGPAPDTVRWVAYTDPEMDGAPIASGVVEPAVGQGALVVQDGAFIQGRHYLLFFADLDDNGEWDEGEPAGFPDRPVDIGWGEIFGVRVGLTQQPNGYRRLFWDADDDPNATYQVVIRRTTSGGAPVIFNRTIRGRNYLHERDLKEAGFTYELDPGASLQAGYEWAVNGELQGSFNIMWTNALTTAPLPKHPIGTWRTAGLPVTWTYEMGDDIATRFVLEIRQDAPTNPPFYTRTIAAPVPRSDGRYAFQLPFLLGQAPLTPGTYYWRIRAQNPFATGPWSADHAFVVDPTAQPGGPFDISGTVWYMGRATPAPINIQAFRSPSMMGTPIQQTVTAGAGTWTLNGLPEGTYYLRAFMDINADGRYQYWEPFGFLRDPDPYQVDYTIRPVTVGPSSANNLIIVRDVDTDNDGFSDAWEWQQFGNLTTVNAGYTGPYAPHSTEIGTAIPDMLPTDLSLDSDGDGVPDVMEIILGFDPLDATSTPPTSQLLQIQSFNEMWVMFDLSPGLPPINQQIGVQLQYTVNMMDWFDVPFARAVVGPGNGPWLINPGGALTAPVLSYRLRWYPINP